MAFVTGIVLVLVSSLVVEPVEEVMPRGGGGGGVGVARTKMELVQLISRPRTTKFDPPAVIRYVYLRKDTDSEWREPDLVDDQHRPIVRHLGATWDPTIASSSSSSSSSTTTIDRFNRFVVQYM